MEWSKKQYNSYYNSYVPWIEDKYLSWYGENKTSYTTKEQLKGTKITGDKNLNAVQDGVAEGVGGQVSSGGLLGGVGDAVSKEGINRQERGETGTEGVQDQGKTWTNTLSGGFMGGGEQKK